MSDNIVPADKQTYQPTYIQVTPSEEGLSPGVFINELPRLYTLCTGGGTSSLRERIRELLGRQPGYASIECLLVSPAETGTLSYYFGVRDGTPGALDALESAVHVLFPDSYEIQQVHGVLYRQSDVVVLGGQAHNRDRYPTVFGVEFRGVGNRRKDWQTALQPYGQAEDTRTQTRSRGVSTTTGSHGTESRSPLSYLIETIAESHLPIVYQTLLTPLPNWNQTASKRVGSLKNGMDTYTGTVLTSILKDRDGLEISEVDSHRVEQINARNTIRSFQVNARLAILTPGNDRIEGRQLAEKTRSAFGHVSGEFHEVIGQVRTDEAGEAVLDDICQRETYAKNYQRLSTLLPLTTNHSRGIVADPQELPHFIAVDGASLPPDARRALETTPTGQTTITRPPESVLETFQGPGMALGYALDNNGLPNECLRLPPERQTEHQAIVGGTGSGKSTALLSGILSNKASTDGADIIIDPKGGRFVEEYLRCHYSMTGSLDDVYYFDCAEWLPAFSFFDIRPALAAGIPRETVVQERISHYEEILAAVTGDDQYASAIRSPDVITSTLELLYDPTHGDDAFRHRDLHETLANLSTDSPIPAVADEDLARRLQGLVETEDRRSFEKIKQGALTRVEKISSAPHLNRIFNHDPHADRQFDLAHILNEDATLIFDTGRLREQIQQSLVIVILSQLWTAIKRRQWQSPETAQPLVNLYLEESPTIAKNDLLGTILSQSRGFDLAVTLALQFPGQMKAADEQTYNELLNEVGTYLTGRVNRDEGNARRFATESMAAPEVANRLGSLSPGQWLIDLPGEFFAQKPDPFLLQSLPLPDGHPDKQTTLPANYTRAKDRAVARTLETVGLTLGDTQTDTTSDTEAPPADQPPAPSQQPSIFELTNRLPACVEYDAEPASLRCAECNRRYVPITTGMRQAIECCNSMQAVDRDNIPVCSYHLKLSPEEITATDWGFRQLVFLQVVHNAQQRRYEPMEYDIVTDSMIRLKEYVGIDTSGIDALIEAGLLTHDGDHPHRLYSVTADGRQLLNNQYRYGANVGHLKGDLGESSQHVCGVVAARRYFEQEYVADPTSDVTKIKPYYQLTEESISPATFMGDGTESPAAEYTKRMLDIAGLNDDGEIVLTCEIERINNDFRRAIPKDYDTMAACEPTEAHWVVFTQSAGHEVLQALQSPPEGDPRVERSYNTNTPPNQFRIDTPGLTDMYSLSWLQRQLQPHS